MTDLRRSGRNAIPTLQRRSANNSIMLAPTLIHVRPLSVTYKMSFFRPEIEAIAGYTPGEQPQDGSFIKLNTNENPYPPSPAVAEAIQKTIARLPKYPHPFGDPFRQKAAELWGVEPDWILCGNGSDDILTIVTRTLVGAGELLRLPYPSYILYRTLAQLQGANFEEVHFQRRLVAAGSVFAIVREDVRSEAGFPRQSQQPFRHGHSAGKSFGNRRAAAVSAVGR